MSPNRVAKRHLTMAEIAKSRALLRLKDKSLVSDLINKDVIEAAVHSQESPDIEMIDNQIDLLIAKGLETSNWATKSHKELNQTANLKEDAKVTITTANSTNEPTPAIKHSIPTPSAPVTKTVSSKPVANFIRPILPLKPKQTSGKKTKGISVSAPVNDLPLELRAVVEAEKQRAAETAANIKTCAIDINGIQEALYIIDNGENKLFQDSLLVYLRAAIAQFMATGPGALPTNLPPRPLVSRHSGDIPPQPISGKSSWATITSIARQKSQDTVSFNPDSSRTGGVTRTHTKALCHISR